MRFSRGVFLLAVWCVALFTGVRAARAERQFGFDLGHCCEHAGTIVLGQFAADNVFEVKEFLFGGEPGAKTLPIEAKYAEELRDALDVGEKTPIEAIIFLDKDGKPVLRHAGVIGFATRGVGLVDKSLRAAWRDDETVQVARHPTLTRDEVLTATRRMIPLMTKRRELLAQPHSTVRITGLMDVLRQDMEYLAESKLPVERPDFQVRQVAIGLRPMHPGEELSVLYAICGLPAPSTEWRIRLLKLAAEIPLSGKAFEAAANWIGPENPPELRKASIAAIGRINNQWASDRLAPLLLLDDECLPEIAHGLCAPRGSTQNWLRSTATVDALRKFMKELSQRDARLSPTQQERLRYVHMAIGTNFHPRLLPGLIEWATRAKDPSAAGAANELRTVLDTDRSDKDLEPILAWWADARGVLEREYDLSRAEGVADWLDAYQKTDEMTRRVMNRLWLFEPLAHEAYLLREATSDRPERAATAKTALAKLWELGRLSATAKSRIIDAFVTVRLIEIPSVNPGSREMQFVMNRKFPFPKLTSLESDLGSSDDGAVPIIRGDSSSHDVEGEGEIAMGGFGGGKIGEPNNRYALILREFDFIQHEVLWTRRWDFGSKDVHKGEARE